MQENEKTITISQSNFLANALALSIAARLLSNHTRFSLEACEHLIIDLAIKQLETLTECEKALVINRYQTIKTSPTN